jgi:hypothetical protein
MFLDALKNGICLSPLKDLCYILDLEGPPMAFVLMVTNLVLLGSGRTFKREDLAGNFKSLEEYPGRRL